MKPTWTGGADLVLGGCEEDFVFLELGVLDLLGTVAMSQRPKRGPDVSLAPNLGGGLDVECIEWARAVDGVY